jgi:molybdopterin-guanine dinucleotide biosynthesis protein A
LFLVPLPIMPESRPDFAAALITGGRSSRMGRDKAFLDWHGEPLWQCQFEKLARLAPALLLISCREDQKITSDRAEVLHDPPENHGPLPALARCLERAQMPLLALAVDMPHVSVSLLQELRQQSDIPDQGAVFRGAHGFEPLCAVYPHATLPLLTQSIADGNFRLQDFVQRAVDTGLLRAIPLSKEREALFFNLNTPADLA